MRTKRIEFISEYCDRWCERCAFTNQCSAYAVQAALGMCGDLKEAIQLAVGEPMKAGASAGARRAVALEFVEPTPEERLELEATVQAYTREIKEAPVTKTAMSIAIAAHRWLHAHPGLHESADSVIREAAQVAAWDNAFIGGKLARAIHGREQPDCDDDPIQNDWNGSAKLALLSLERSEAAWQTMSEALGDSAAAVIASRLAALRTEVEELFPFARLFKRPGFDELRG